MALMTSAQYVESIRAMSKRNVYYMGEKIENTVDHPVLRPSLNCLIETYDMALMPEFEDLMTAHSELIGEKVNRFSHIHTSIDDLIKKVKMQRLVGQRTGMCYQRCVVMDGANALYCTTYEIDKKHGTRYQDNFLTWFKRVQREDLYICAGITDPKGDRNKRPTEQPEQFLRIVERRSDGVVVDGAKMHLTSCVNAHEIFTMPTMSLKTGEEDFAISFAIPMDAPGITMIIGRNSSDLRKIYGKPMDVGNAKFGGIEAVVVFDHVFIPNERIFLNGEVEFAGLLVDRFASYHRNSYGGCKSGVGDVLIGAANLYAEYNGVEKTAHIKDKLVEMTHMNETLYSGGVASSCEGYQMPAGNYIVDPMLANCCKLSVTRYPYEMCRLAEDIAGGLMVTGPSAADFDNPETGEYLRKLLTGANGVGAEDKLRSLRLLETMCIGTGAVGYRTESMHGAGSPAAQKLNISRYANLNGKKEFSKRLCGIDDEKS